MKVATPQSLPDGDSSSAGMMVSTAALMNSTSVAFRVSQVSGAWEPVAQRRLVRAAPSAVR